MLFFDQPVRKRLRSLGSKKKNHVLKELNWKIMLRKVFYTTIQNMLQEGKSWKKATFSTHELK